VALVLGIASLGVGLDTRAGDTQHEGGSGR